MANGALVITWGAPVRGREMQGLEVFGNALAYYDEMAKEGRIHGHHEYFCLSGDVGKRAGIMIVDGDLAVLARLQVEERNIRLLAQAGEIAEHMNVTLCEANSEQAIGRYVEVTQEMGLG